jgi:hypothetical protein
MSARPLLRFLHPTQRPAQPQPPKSFAAINRNPPMAWNIKRMFALVPA